MAHRSRLLDSLVISMVVANLFTLYGGISMVGATESQAHRFATDQVSRQFEIPITSTDDGLSVPSILTVSSARLDSQQSGDPAITAPKGSLFLSLQMSSAPKDRSYGDPLWGKFFSQLEPLPASAFSFTVKGGQIYPASRTNVTAPDPNSTGGVDNLVGATYYFSVPDSVRSGTVTIARTQTTGIEYQGFVGADTPSALEVSGPTTFALSFPQALEVATTTSGLGSNVPTATSGAPIRSIGVVALVVLGGGLAVLLARRRPNATPETEAEVDSTSTPPADEAEFPTPHAPPAAFEDAVVKPEQAPGLRVNVLGPLTFDPPIPGVSDPALSLLCFLAFHQDRPMSRGEIQTALWPTNSTTKDVTPGTFRNYVTEARRAVGPAVLPEASRGADYRLLGVSTDVEEFRALINQAKASDEATSLELRQQALELARDEPFAGQVSSFFEWVHSEGLVGELCRTVSDLAYRTGMDLHRAGDLDGAEQALRTGLRVAPAMLSLWEELVDVVAQRDARPGLDRLWPQAEAQLGVDGVAELRRRVTI